MPMGPCGIACTLCRFFTQGSCQGCIRGDLCPPERAAQSLCAILRCAAARRIPYCFRDCPDFPCALFHADFPTCWSQGKAQSIWGEAFPMSMAGARPALAPEMDTPGGAGLRVYCLGPLRVRQGTHEVQWNHSSGPAQKVKAMFAFLLSRKARGARKETLIDLLWPEQNDGRRADNTFHLTVHCLRRALEPGLQHGTDSSFIRFEGGRYYFRARQLCWIDADAFEAHTREARLHEQREDLDKAVEHWGTSVDLYAGEFMADIQLEYTENLLYDWCLPRRRRLRESYLTALEKLAGYHFRTGALNLAVQYAHEALETEPAFEPAHRMVMHCLIAGGQPEQAMRQFRLCAAELAEREGRPPSPQTRQLYQSLVD